VLGYVDDLLILPVGIMLVVAPRATMDQRLSTEPPLSGPDACRSVGRPLRRSPASGLSPSVSSSDGCFMPSKAQRSTVAVQLN
jgi:uncharacterized membrane protein YkvA (DUF1232 family)